MNTQKARIHSEQQNDHWQQSVNFIKNNISSRQNQSNPGEHVHKQTVTLIKHIACPVS